MKALIRFCRGIPETSRRDEPGRVGRNREMELPNNANIVLQEAVNAVQWGMQNNAEMSDIITQLSNRLDNRGHPGINREQAVSALEAASIMTGYMEGMPSRYHHLFQSSSNRGW